MGNEKRIEFNQTLCARIEVLRPKISIDPKYQTRGVRFKDTEYISQAIQGSVLVGMDPKMKGVVLKESGGLEFEQSQISMGLYDPIIIRMLSDAATIDFKNEGRIDLH